VTNEERRQMGMGRSLKKRKEKKRKDGKGVHDFGAIDFACGHAADL